MKNTIYYGDNLDIMRKYIPSESIDLIYLDPPFNSKKLYNIIYKDPTGKKSESQVMAFSDTWKWDKKAEEIYRELVERADSNITKVITSYYSLLGDCSLMAYLVMMTIRLIEMKRVLKDTGSIYLHCDPTSSHYLKIVMDNIFCAKNFRNEIVWNYGGRGAKAISKSFGRNHDIILFYSKSNNISWNELYLRRIDSFDGYKFDENVGKYYDTSPRGDYTDKSIEKLRKDNRIYVTRNGNIRIKYFREYTTKGVIKEINMGSVWSDIPDTMHISKKERCGYPTQKPEALMERIIKASSNDGDTVLDPFCGCATTLIVSQKLKRKWIGIDVTYHSVKLLEERFEKNHLYANVSANGLKHNIRSYGIIGEPESKYAAEELFKSDAHEFATWSILKINGKPNDKKTGDGGIDGFYDFMDGPNRTKAMRGLIQVTGGKKSLTIDKVKAFCTTVSENKAPIGIFITLHEPTDGMKREFLKQGKYISHSGQKYPKIQFVTIAEIIENKILDIPWVKKDFPQRKIGIVENNGKNSL